MYSMFIVDGETIIVVTDVCFFLQSSGLTDTVYDTDSLLSKTEVRCIFLAYKQ